MDTKVISCVNNRHWLDHAKDRMAETEKREEGERRTILNSPVRKLINQCKVLQSSMKMNIKLVPNFKGFNSAVQKMTN